MNTTPTDGTLLLCKSSERMDEIPDDTTLWKTIKSSMTSP